MCIGFSTPEMPTPTAPPAAPDADKTKARGLEEERRRLAARQGRGSTVLASGMQQRAPQTSSVLVTGGKKKLGE